MGKSWSEHPEQQGSRCEGPVAGTNLVQTKEGALGRNAKGGYGRGRQDQITLSLSGQSLVFGVYSYPNENQ